MFEKTDTTGMDLEDGSDEFLAPFLSHHFAFGRFEELLHGRTNVGFDRPGELVLSGNARIQFGQEYCRLGFVWEWCFASLSLVSTAAFTAPQPILA
jgi:hypothetical protein